MPLRQIEGSRAVAETVALCRPEVIGAYPISPQTHIVEALSEIVKTRRAGAVRVRQRRVGVRGDVGRDRRLGDRRAHLHRDREPGPAVHGRGALQRLRARPADRDDRRQPRDRRADQHLERPLATRCRSATPAGSSSTPRPTRRRSTCTSRRSGSPRSSRCRSWSAWTASSSPTPSSASTCRRRSRSTPSCRRSCRARCSTRTSPVTIGAMVGPEAFTEVRYLMHAKQMQALDAIPEIAADFAAAFGRESGGLVRALPQRGRRDGRRRARLRARHDRGRHRRAARRGRLDRRARDQVLPPVAVRRGARGARATPSAWSCSRRRFAVGAGGIVGQNVRLALSGLTPVVYDVVAGLGGRADHQGVAARGCSARRCADELGRLTFLDLDTRARRARARADGRRRAARARTPRTCCATSASSRRGRSDALPADQVLPGGLVRGRQPPARPRAALRAGRHRALEHADLRPPRLPGLRRGARRALRARRRDARDRADS